MAVGIRSTEHPPPPSLLTSTIRVKIHRHLLYTSSAVALLLALKSKFASQTILFIISLLLYTDIHFRFIKLTIILSQDLVEATLAGIQARVQLYGTCSGGYAARAISSIDVENFHSVLNRQHHHGGEMASLYEVQGSMSHIVVATKIKKEAMFRNLLEIRDEDSHYPLPETGIDLSQKLCLNNCRFDIVAGSKRNKEVGLFQQIALCNFIAFQSQNRCQNANTFIQGYVFLYDVRTVRTATGVLITRVAVLSPN